MGNTNSPSQSGSYAIPANGVYNVQKSNVVTLQTRYICIGINYPKTEFKLNKCIEDALNMEKFITSRKNGCVGILMSDDVDPSSPLYPCKKNIIRGLKWCMSSATVEDFMSETDDFPAMKSNTTCFMTYSGHGSQVADTNGDEADRKDEVICPVYTDGTFDAYIVDDQLGSVLYQGCRKDCNIIIITDSCNSGSNTDFRFTINGRAFMQNRKYPIFPGPIFHISGSRDTQSSYEDSSGGYLTNAFIETMSNSSYPGLYVLITILRANISKKIKSNLQLPQLSAGHVTSAYARFPL